MIKVNARVLQLVKHHDCSIYFRYDITRAHTYIIVILCVPVTTHGHLIMQKLMLMPQPQRTRARWRLHEMQAGRSWEHQHLC